jgi:hypothetical protein
MSKLQGLQSSAAVVGIAIWPLQSSQSDKVQSDCNDGARGLAPSRSQNPEFRIYEFMALYSNKSAIQNS